VSEGGEEGWDVIWGEQLSRSNKDGEGKREPITTAIQEIRDDENSSCSVILRDIL
jgi:hypothetical protein